MTRIRFTESASFETDAFAAFSDISHQKVRAMTDKINRAVKVREAQELESREEQSTDFQSVLALANDSDVARLFAVCGVNPDTYISGVNLSNDEYEAKSGLSSLTRTRNLKAYKKTRELAHYLASGSKLESVVKVAVACSIMCAQNFRVLPRDLCEAFLTSIPLSYVSAELSEAIDQYRAKHMTGGAPTQTSQVMLTLSQLGAVRFVQNGRNKDMVLNPHHVVIRSFAQRFNLTAQLERAQRFYDQMEADAVNVPDDAETLLTEAENVSGDVVADMVQDDASDVVADMIEESAE